MIKYEILSNFKSNVVLVSLFLPHQRHRNIIRSETEGNVVSTNRNTSFSYRQTNATIHFQKIKEKKTR